MKILKKWTWFGVTCRQLSRREGCAHRLHTVSYSGVRACRLVCEIGGMSFNLDVILAPGTQRGKADAHDGQNNVRFLKLGIAYCAQEMITALSKKICATMPKPRKGSPKPNT